MPLHLLRIGTTYYFRLVVPTDLRQFFPLRELKHSLKSKSKTAAAKQHAKYEIHYQSLFSQLRLLSMPKPSISFQAIELWLKQNPDKAFTPPELAPYSPFGNKNAAAAIQTLLDYGYVPDEYGKFDLTQPPANYPHELQPQPQPQAPTIYPHEPQPQPHRRKSARLEEVFRQYFDLLTKGDKYQRQLKPSSLAAYRYSLNPFVRFVGPKGTIDDACRKIDAYIDAQYSGSNRTKTINNTVKNLKHFFNFAVTHGFISETPKINRVVSKPNEANTEGNQAYNTDQIKGILSALIVPVKQIANLRDRERNRKTRIELLCLVLIAMYTGYRINEIRQLSIDDIQSIDGIACLSLLDIDSKTPNARRYVPISQALLDIDFPSILQKLGRRNQGTLFSKIYSTYNKAHLAILAASGITGRPNQYTFHSWRATMNTALNDKGCPDVVRNNIIGHATAGQQRNYDYLTPDRLAVMQQYINQVHANIDLKPIAAYLQAELKK